MRITTYDTRLNDEGLSFLIKDKAVNYAAEKREMKEPYIIVNMMNTVFESNKKDTEYLHMLCFDTHMNLKGVFEISHGTVNASIVSPREVFIKALLGGAVNIILTHNHPSGNLFPSESDMALTERVKEAGDLINVKLVDHIIIGDNDYLSMKEHDYCNL